MHETIEIFHDDSSEVLQVPPPFHFSSQVYYKGQHAGSGADGLSEIQGGEHAGQLTAAVMTSGSERVEHFPLYGRTLT